MAAILESKKVHRRDKVKNANFEEKVVSVSRVTKVTKGGRTFSFSALVVIGNNHGCFGVGLGKALEVSSAKKKAINDAKNNLFHACLTKSKTIPHVIKAKFGATTIIARPAKPGTGIIAGGAARLLFECVGIKDIVAKTIGSSNNHNVTKATQRALMTLRSRKYFEVFHGISAKEDSFSEDDFSEDTGFENDELDVNKEENNMN
jgi:small subunit ribosomal protein S5